jgi:hypothetical protein
MKQQPGNEQSSPIAVVAEQTPPRVKPSIYPERFASRMVGREKHPPGDLFGYCQAQARLCGTPIQGRMNLST